MFKKRRAIKKALAELQDIEENYDENMDGHEDAVQVLLEALSACGGEKVVSKYNQMVDDFGWYCAE